MNPEWYNRNYIPSTADQPIDVPVPVSPSPVPEPKPEKKTCITCGGTIDGWSSFYCELDQPNATAFD